MKRRYILTVFAILVLCVDAFCSGNNQMVVGIKITNEYENGNYSFDSLRYYNSELGRYAKSNSFEYINDSLYVLNEDYEEIVKSDSVWLYIGYIDNESNRTFSLAIPISKRSLNKSFSVSLRKCQPESRFHCYIGKRNGYEKWINIGLNLKKRKHRLNVFVSNPAQYYCTDFAGAGCLIEEPLIPSVIRMDDPSESTAEFFQKHYFKISENETNK